MKATRLPPPPTHFLSGVDAPHFSSWVCVSQREGALPVPFKLGELLPYPTLLWGPGGDENWLGNK